MSTVYIRPTVVEDAMISYRWRNIPRLWKYTAYKPTKEVTYEEERDWLEKKLQDKSQIRFSICLKETDQYIGYMFLDNLTEDSGEIHTLIGEIAYWGGGRAIDAAKLVFKHMFEKEGKQKIFTRVNKKNLGSIKLTLDMGLEQIEESFDEATGFDIIKYVIYKEKFYELFPEMKG